MYELHDVSRTYKLGRQSGRSGRTVHALAEVNLTIPDGQMLAIQGPTGGGKSTLLNLLGALDRPTAGEVVLDDTPISQANDRQLAGIRARQIGFIFQSFNLIPTLNALENVEMALVPLRVGHEEGRRRAEAALERMGLADRATHLPSELSGGQQQRVSIARALVKEPRMVLGDEPTGNLDEDTRDEIMDELEELWRDDGVTLIVVTHDSAVAARAQRRLYIAKGQVREWDARQAKDAKPTATA